MNILIPHHWLLDHLKTKAKPKEIQEYLSLSGPSVETIEKIEGDDVYDIEVTTNRVDAMSIRGIAREAAVILTRYKLNSELKPFSANQNIKIQADELPLPKINNDPKICQRITCIVMSNVEQKESPKWLKKRLAQSGFQAHDNLIDITNYVTHEIGHPCHVFDYDKIMELGGVINVGTAKKGKPFTTLDGVERETVGGEIVLTNEIGTIIDLPAIMGTANSCVNKNTKNILFWMEDLDAQKVRRASINHAIRTNAAQLNEKEVDPTLTLDTLYKGVELYQKLAGGKIASEVYDDYPQQRQVSAFKVKGSTIVQYLGIELKTQQVIEILSDLGCETKIVEGNKSSELKSVIIEVNPPTFRPDLKIPADIVEEIARIYGYQNLPSTLMTGEIPQNQPQDVDFNLEDKIKSFLSHIGWQEIYSLSLVSEDLAKNSGYKLEQHLKLNNPLTVDNEYLRRSLIPSLEEAVAANPQVENLSVFELAVTYEPKKENLPQQSLKLGLVSKKSYREVRGDLESLLEKFYIDLNKIKVEELENKHQSQDKKYVQQKAEVMLQIDKKSSTKLGEIWILHNNLIAAEIDYQTILAHAKKYPQYQPKVKTTPIIEDLTFTLSTEIKVGEVIDQIKKIDEMIIKVKLTDVYQQNHTFEIQYQDAQKNLTNEDIGPVRKKLVDTIETNFQAKLVGSV